MITLIVHFSWGVALALYWAAGLFFWRFWRKTNDRLFGMFAISLWLLGTERLVAMFLNFPQESQPWVYLLRLSAFVLILIAVVDKNRAKT